MKINCLTVLFVTACAQRDQLGTYYEPPLAPQNAGDADRPDPDPGSDDAPPFGTDEAPPGTDDAPPPGDDDRGHDDALPPGDATIAPPDPTCRCTHPLEIAPMDPSTRDGLSPGPVTRYRAYVYWIQNLATGELRPFSEVNGRTVVYVGERVMFDSTQKGDSDNRPCVWIDDPVWTLCDYDCAFVRRYNANAYHLKLDVVAPGEITVYATVDGIRSNDVTLEAQP